MFQLNQSGWYPQSLRLQRLLIVIVALYGLSGCGAGGENADGGESQDSVNEVTDTEADSSAIADHEVTSGFSYEHYRVVELSLDLMPYDSMLSGEQMVVKVYDSAQTYFLGSQTRSGELQLTLSLPRHVERVWVEVFDADSATGSIVEEVLL